MRQEKRHVRRAWALAAALGVAGGAALPAVAMAGPAATIYSPIVDYREWELELKAGIQDWNQPDGERAAKLAIGYGVMPRWGMEVEAEYSQTPGGAGRVEEYEFENIFQLTEHGEHWLDAGIFAELEHNRLENVNKLVLGPMFQRETQHTQSNLNVYWERRLSARPDGANHNGDVREPRNELAYQVQWKYNLHPHFQPGLQAFGSLGDPAHLHSAELKIGPAFFGDANLGNAKGLHYDAAILAGVTRGAPGMTIRFQLEYEFF